MSPLAAGVREGASVGDAADFLLEAGVPVAPVLNDHDKLVGFLSERDVMAGIVSPDCWRRPVRDVMRSDAICYEETTPVRVIYEFLCRVSVSRMLITDQGRPTGTIGRDSILRWFQDRAAKTADPRCDRLSAK